MIEYYEDIFEKLENEGIIKTIEMTSFVTKGLIPIEQKRLCSTCGNYLGKLKCRLIGKIKNPNCNYCSWYKDKKTEVKTIRGYRRIK